MKSFLASYRVSNSFDDGMPSMTVEGKRGALDPSERDLREVDRCLRRGPRPIVAPKGLHSAIMRAIRNNPEPQLAAEGLLPHIRWALWAPATAVAGAMVLLLAVVLLNRSAESNTHHHALLATGSSLAAGQVKPPPIVAPLSTELRNFEQDLASTARHLRASLP